jgi:hypothetical protein
MGMRGNNRNFARLDGIIKLFLANIFDSVVRFNARLQSLLFGCSQQYNFLKYGLLQKFKYKNLHEHRIEAKTPLVDASEFAVAVI